MFTNESDEFQKSLFHAIPIKPARAGSQHNDALVGRLRFLGSTLMPVPFSPASRAPRVVITMGLHGSASTWAFNVARELITTTVGADAVLSCFGAGPAALLAQEGILGRHLVCKTHGWPNLHVFAYLTSAVVIVTVRDPRDCVLSLMERFQESLSNSVAGITRDCLSATHCADAGYPVLLYEDRFFDDPATVQAIARHLGVEVSDAVADDIFNRYRTEEVRAFAAEVETLPSERLEGDGKPLLFDRVTHITRTHIGDGRVGKWRERFDPPHRAALARHFAAFLSRFGYSSE
jgi:hypothetical protein